MSFINKFSNYIASKIALSLELDEDNIEVLAYGAFSLLQTLWSILLVVIFGFIFNLLFECLIISISGALLRKYSGGAHATSPNRCAVIGSIAAVLLALLNRYIISLHFIFILVFISFAFILSYYIINRLAPVDTPNKPIIKEKTKLRLKKQSIRLIHILLIANMILCFLSIYMDKKYLLSGSLAISLGMIWQSITLTTLGHYIITSLDKLLERVFIRG